MIFHDENSDFPSMQWCLLQQNAKNTSPRRSQNSWDVATPRRGVWLPEKSLPADPDAYAGGSYGVILKMSQDTLRYIFIDITV